MGGFLLSELLRQYQVITSGCIVGMCIVSVYFWRLLSRRNRPEKRTPPTLTFLQYVTILKGVYTQSHPTRPATCLILQSLWGAVKLFQRDGMMKFRLGLNPVMAFFKPETVEIVLSSSTMIDKGPTYDWLHPWLGTGLLTSLGEKWRRRRKLLTPTFHFGILKDFLPVFNKHAKNMASKIEELSDKPWTDVRPLMGALTLDIVCETAMGVRITSQDNSLSKYTKSVDEFGCIYAHRLLRPWLHFDFIFNLTATGRRTKELIELLNDFTTKIIKKKKNEMLRLKKMNSEGEISANGSSSHPDKYRIFLELLLEHHFKNPTSFTELDVRNEVNTFMVAGYETTATTMAWVFYILGVYEDVQDRVLDELNDVFQGDLDRDVTREDVTQLKYMDCVIKETLRLFSPAIFLSRIATETFEAAGYTVERGDMCSIFVPVLHRDPVSFPEPEKFDPERFFPENCAGRHPYAYVPFSAGPRNCIGQKFALLEMKTVLATVLRKFQVKSLDPRDKVNMIVNLVIRSCCPLRVQFIPRAIKD